MPCLVASVGYVLLMFSLLSDSYNLSVPSSLGFSELGWEALNGDLQFRLSLLA